MGRWSTGIYTTRECLKINISHFKKENLFKRNGVGTGSLSWNNGANIGIRLEINEHSQKLVLTFTHTDRQGNKTDITQNINIVSVPSNLGRGEVFYFQCPLSFNSCRILYMGYGSQHFKCRKAYRNRIYYNTQTRGKLDRFNSRYWDLDELIPRLRGKQRKSLYRGKPTRLQSRINRLTDQKDYCDEMRWQILPKSIIKMMGKSGIKY